MVSMIVAVAQNGVIGKDNRLIWRLSDDLKNFKAVTLGHSIIMGRKTYESIGRPLQNRHNIVVTRSRTLVLEGCTVVHSLAEAYKAAEKAAGAEEYFLIGGADLYAQALSDVDKIYLTLIDASPEGDAFFDLDLIKTWKVASETFFDKSEKNEFAFSIKILTKP